LAPAIPNTVRKRIFRRNIDINLGNIAKEFMLTGSGGAFSYKENNMLHYKLIAAAAAFFVALGTSAIAQTSDNSSSQPAQPTTSQPAPQPDQGATPSGSSGQQQQPQSGTDNTTSSQPQQGQDSSTPQPH
jgi:hypothetical protein